MEVKSIRTFLNILDEKGKKVIPIFFREVELRIELNIKHIREVTEFFFQFLLWHQGTTTSPCNF